MFQDVKIYVRSRIHLAKDQTINWCIKDRILKSALVYQFLCKTMLHKNLSILEIVEKHPDIGLIGPGNGCLTKVLEYLFSWSKTICTHAILHDAFGRFFDDYKTGPGYCYALWRNQTGYFMKSSALLGHITGVFFCLRYTI